MPERGSIGAWLFALTIAMAGCQTADPLSELFPSDSGSAPTNGGVKSAATAAQKNPADPSMGPTPASDLKATKPKIGTPDSKSKSTTARAPSDGSTKRLGVTANGDITLKATNRSRAAAPPPKAIPEMRSIGESLPIATADSAARPEKTGGAARAPSDGSAKRLGVTANGDITLKTTNRSRAAAPPPKAIHRSLPSPGPISGTKSLRESLPIATADPAARPEKTGGAAGLPAIGPARAAIGAASPTPLRLESLLGDEKAHQTWRDQYLAKRSRSIGPQVEEETRPQAQSSGRQATEAKPDALPPSPPAQTR